LLADNEGAYIADNPASIATSLGGKIEGEGEVELPGEYRGLSDAKPIPSRGAVALAVAWRCPFKDADDIGYLALQQFPDPGEAYWSDSEKTLASQLICSPPELREQ
jgi:hypothetical protein